MNSVTTILPMLPHLVVGCWFAPPRRLYSMYQLRK
jgi:hypothetical protein